MRSVIAAFVDGYRRFEFWPDKNRVSTRQWKRRQAMRLSVTIALMIVLAFLTAGSAMAQSRKYEINIGGGFSLATGDIEEHFGNGGNFEAGFTFLVNDKLGFQAQYSYTKLNGKNFTFPVAPTFGGVLSDQTVRAHMNMHAVSADVVIKPDGVPGVYIVGGPGVYKRTVSLSTTQSAGFAAICDPHWFVCFPSPVSIDNVIGDRSSTDFGLNAGGGYAFKVSDSARLYVEARYLYVWGPDVFNGQKLTSSANGQFFPISFGIRW